MSINSTVSRPGNVHELLAQGPRSWESACALISEVAAEVADGHSRGLTHLALAPAAIILDDSGAYDGILERSEVVASATTLHYTAPEILVDAEPDLRCDVYSLGAILLALVSGRHPFRAQNSTAQAAIARILHDVPDLDIPGTPAALAMLLENALRKNPEHRTVTAAEFARVTRKLAAGSSVSRVMDQPVPDDEPQRVGAGAAAMAAPTTSGSGINWIAGGLAVALFFGVLFTGAVVAKLAGGDDVTIDLARPVIRPVPEAGGEGAPTSAAIEPVADAPRVAESAPVVAESAAPDSGDGTSASAAFVSALANAETHTDPDEDTDTDTDPVTAGDVDPAPDVDTEVLGEQEEDGGGLEIVPILKSAWDEYDLVVGDALDVNVLDNDSLGGRAATVTLAPDALLPSGFLLASNGRLAGIAQVCGVTETGYQLTTDNGVTSTSILRMVVTGCDEG